MDIRRVKFTTARVAQLIRDLKAKKVLPPWAADASVRDGFLYIGGLEVIPSEKVDDWLRSRVYGSKPIAMSRDAGYTDFIAKETLGISRRAWFDFLSKQDTHQRFTARPKPTKNPGRRLASRGYLEMDLVEVKAKDVPTRKTDTYIFTLIDKLTSYLCALPVSTKQVNPKRARGTLIVGKELFSEMEKKLGKSIKEVAHDDGGEFKAELRTWIEKKGIRSRTVPLGPAIEARNGVIQRHLYKLIAMGRRGGLDKLIAEAVDLCNQTTSRITGKSPEEALTTPDRELSIAFNKKRQAPGKVVGQKIKRGDYVIILTKGRKADKFYKSYRDHWSNPEIVKAVRGLSIVVPSGTYPRNRVKRVAEVDKKSNALLEGRKQRERTKKQKAKPKAAAPRRSGRASKKLISDSKYSKSK